MYSPLLIRKLNTLGEKNITFVSYISTSRSPIASTQADLVCFCHNTFSLFFPLSCSSRLFKKDNHIIIHFNTNTQIAMEVYRFLIILSYFYPKVKKREVTKGKIVKE